MSPSTKSLAYLIWVLTLPRWVLAEGNGSESGGVTAPDGVLSANCVIRGGKPEIDVSYGSQHVSTIHLGLEFSSGLPLVDVLHVSYEHSEHDETYPIPVGKHDRARDHHHELLWRIMSRTAPGTETQVRLRVFDEGIAFRYEIPNRPLEKSYTLKAESTKFHFSRGTRVDYLPLAGFETSYEGYYESNEIQDLPSQKLLALPILFILPANRENPIYVAVAEANLKDYAGMYLTREPENPSALSARLSPIPGRSDQAKVVGDYPFRSPWRVLFAGARLGSWLESNLLFHLNPPSRIPQPAWIRPGKTTFPWWNGYVLENVDFQPGLNTQTQLHYIDFCAEHGVPYHSLDGTDSAWYGGPIIPNGPCDITKAVPEIDLPKVLAHAQAKGVRLRAWMHWKALRAQLDEALATYQSWGLEGIMVDFMDRDDQEMIAFYHEVAEKAAQRQLTVTWHGVCKPTGMERTWPNVLSYEAALNQEYDKWDPKGTPARHNLDISLIRGLAGPVDYHLGGMRSVAIEQFQPRYRAPFVMGTRAHQLALYVVLQNHLAMLADYPQAYAGQVGLDFLTEVPSTWDETRVLAADREHYVVVARRREDTWYLGAIGAGAGQSLEIPLSWLPPNATFDLTSFEDCLDGGPTEVRVRSKRVTAADCLSIQLVQDGGMAGVVRPSKPAAEPPSQEK